MERVIKQLKECCRGELKQKNGKMREINELLHENTKDED